MADFIFNQGSKVFLRRIIIALIIISIFSLISVLITGEDMKDISIQVYNYGKIVYKSCTVLTGFFLLLLSCFERTYLLSGLFLILSVLLNHLSDCFIQDASSLMSVLISVIPGNIFLIIGTRCEYSAHAKIIHCCDESLSCQWISLWKRFFLVDLLSVCSIILTHYFPICSLLIFSSGILLWLIEIYRIIYLYNMVRFYDNTVYKL